MDSQLTLTAETNELTLEAIWRALDRVVDPEIPVVSLVEMGIIREVQLEGDSVVVAMTPTFAGCPALEMMRAEIVRELHALGAARVEVKMVLSPPWTSDRMSESARAKLRSIGLAPPPLHGGNVMLHLEAPAKCPYCGSLNTRVTNNFGPTLCRAIHYCRDCNQPFEQFKPI